MLTQPHNPKTSLYQKPFFITENFSNNAFNFERRKAALGHTPSLYVPQLRVGTIADVEVGDQVVFEDYDDENLKSCKGLKNFIRTNIQGVPAVVFDNHNHAFYFWHLAHSEKIIQKGALLIHVDGHKDNRTPETFLLPADAYDLEKNFAYTNTVLNVGNFIPPAQKDGLITEVLQVTSEDALRELDFQIGHASDNENENGDHCDGGILAKYRGNIILDLDLDFFAHELNYIPEKLKISVTRKIMKRSQFMTIATSPFFIEQERAIHFFGKLL